MTNRRKSNIFSCFLRNRRGAAALEFALVGPIHLALILGMMETGMLMGKIALLELGTASAAKQVYIGAAAESDEGLAAVKEDVCKYVGRLQPSCMQNIIVELTDVSDFQTPPSLGDDCEKIESDDSDKLRNFRTGASSSVMYMRVCLTTDIIFPGVGAGLDLNTPGETGKYQFVSASVFQNEPF